MEKELQSTAVSDSGKILRIAGIVRESIVDGKGIRFTVFRQGCPHHCPGIACTSFASSANAPA